jgi:spermidine/putrescine ABC transporter ATP-binding subunit
MAESIVVLDNVSKIYGRTGAEVYAVRQVSLTVQAGEFFSLLGSSGSGKTTTLRLIGGFELPDAGQVFIGGEQVTTLPPYRRNVHTVFQSYALFPHLSVAANIAYPLKLAKVSQAEIQERVAESLRMFRIEGLGDRRPAQLSGGQQQRVALARALVNRPKVLLLDEPLSALDAKIRQEVREELRGLQHQLGLTFIYVTHDQEEALALSDRIAVMHDGQVEQLGSPVEIYNHPATQFVAQFIGKGNFLQGTVTEIQVEHVVVTVKGVAIQAIAPTWQLTPGDAVTLMIRPECLHPGVGDASHENQIPGQLVNTTYIGQLYEQRVETPVGTLMVAQLGQLGTGISQETMTLGWRSQDCVVLPAPSTV